MDDALTLVSYTVEGHRYGYLTLDEVADAMARYGEGPLTKHTRTYRVGDNVEVHYRGRWRPGKVVSLKKVRVVVHFKRNQQGDWGAKAFRANEIRPRGEGEWVRT